MPSAFGDRDQTRQRVGIHHGAGRIGRARHHQAGERLLAVLGDQRLGRQRPARLGRGLDQHRLATERGEDVPVRRIAGIGQRHPVARLEQRQKRQDEAAGGAGGHHHARRIEREIVGLGVVAGDSRPQARECRASRYSRCGRASAACAACQRGAGAGAAGWPTSMCTTRAPLASSAAAAAITSMTMNGGTSLRLEGISRCFAASSIVNRAVGPRPAVAVFPGLALRSLRFS